MNISTKKEKDLERIFKGVANSNRVRALFYLKNHAGASLTEIVKHSRGTLKTQAEHIRKLVSAGLVQKKYDGRIVRHRLTPYGKKLSVLIESFAKSHIK